MRDLELFGNDYHSIEQQTHFHLLANDHGAEIQNGEIAVVTRTCYDLLALTFTFLLLLDSCWSPPLALFSPFWQDTKRTHRDEPSISDETRLHFS